MFQFNVNLAFTPFFLSGRSKFFIMKKSFCCPIDLKLWMFCAVWLRLSEIFISSNIGYPATFIDVLTPERIAGITRFSRFDREFGSAKNFHWNFSPLSLFSPFHYIFAGHFVTSAFWCWYLIQYLDLRFDCIDLCSPESIGAAIWADKDVIFELTVIFCQNIARAPKISIYSFFDTGVSVFFPSNFAKYNALTRKRFLVLIGGYHFVIAV